MLSYKSVAIQNVKSIEFHVMAAECQKARDATVVRDVEQSSTNLETHRAEHKPAIYMYTNVSVVGEIPECNMIASRSLHCRAQLLFSNSVLGLRLCYICLLYTSPSPRDRTRSRMPSSA